MGIVLPAYIKDTCLIKNLKFAQLANRLFNVDYNNFSYEKMANILGDRIRKYINHLD